MGKENLQGNIGACGLDCGACDILKAPTDPEAEQRLVLWLRRNGWLKEGEGISEIVERSMYCKGCRGDRTVHWSPDCWILKCCVDDKGLEFCHECGDFPCGKLRDWARGNADYAKALERLKRLKGKGGT